MPEDNVARDEIDDEKDVQFGALEALANALLLCN